MVSTWQRKMASNCRFCDLTQGRRACKKVYEDDRFLAFLDRCPVNEGHVLVIPKAHAVEFQDVDDETYLSMMTLVKQIGKAIKSCFQPLRLAGGLCILTTVVFLARTEFPAA